MGIGETRSRTRLFKQERLQKQKSSRRTRAKLASRFELAVFKQEHSPPSSSFSLSSSKVYYDTKEKEIDLSKMTHCQQCAQVFSFFGAKLRQCPTCRRIVCNQNCFTEKTEISGGDGKTKVRVCILCYKHLLRQRSVDEFKVTLATSLKLPLIIAYNTLIALRKEIDRLMPAFRGLTITLTGDTEDSMRMLENVGMMDVDNLFYLQNCARDNMKSLEAHFKNLEKRLKRVTDVKIDGQRHLQQRIKAAIVEFLRRSLPEFKMLTGQLNTFLATPEISHILSNYESNMSRVAIEEKQEELLQARLEEHKRVLARASSSRLAIPSQQGGGKRRTSGADFLTMANSPPSPAPDLSSPNNPFSSNNPFASSPSPILVPVPTATPTTTPPQSSTSSTSPPSGKSLWSRTVGKLREVKPSSRRGPPNVSLEIEESSRPLISMVKPAIVPIHGGTFIMIHGERFQDGCEVIIGGARVPAADVGFVAAEQGSHFQFLKVKAPPLSRDKEGPQTLIIINPDKQTAILNDVLFYTSDPALFS